MGAPQQPQPQASYVSSSPRSGAPPALMSSPPSPPSLAGSGAYPPTPAVPPAPAIGARPPLSPPALEIPPVVAPPSPKSPPSPAVLSPTALPPERPPSSIGSADSCRETLPHAQNHSPKAHTKSRITET